MSNYISVRELVTDFLKGITPTYVLESDTIVLNQKCIRNNQIDYSFAQFHDQTKLFSEKKVIRKGDLLINSTGQGTAGRCAFVKNLPENKKVITDSHILIIRVEDFFTAGCLDYSLFSNEKLLQTFIDGSTGQGEFDKERLFNILTSMPDTKDRIFVYQLLNNLDTKIELNNKINAGLEQMANTLYDYWFLQFDFPNNEGKPYRSSGGKMVWSKELKREIPENWKIFSLADLIKESKNGDWGKEETEDGFIKTYCIRGADINGLNGIESFDPPIRYIDGAHSNRLLKPDDLIVEISGGSPTQSTGRMAHASKDVIARLQNRAVCSNFCKAISLKDMKLSYIVNHYWRHLYQSGVFFNFEGKTSGIKNLLFDQLIKDVMIALPKSNGSIEKYYYIAENIDTFKQNNLLQNQKLAELRDWLLPMLMNGQVTVKN